MQGDGDGAWRCVNCGNTNRSKLTLSDDGATSVCVCGACVSACFKEARFKATERGDVQAAREVVDMDSANLASASKRQRTREYAVAGSSVPNALKNASARVARVAVQTSALQGMTTRDKKRLDQTLIGVHATFKSAGFSSDDNVLCKKILRTTTQFFGKASTHAAYCKETSRACIASLCTGANTKLVARTAIISELRRAEAYANREEMYESMGHIETLRMTRQLRGRLAEDTAVSKNAESAMALLMTCDAARLCQPCCTESESDDFAATEDVVEADVPDVDIETFISKVSMSARSIVELGLCDEQMSHVALTHLFSPVCVHWLCQKTCWPPDVVALLSVCKLWGSGKSTLRKITRQHKISKASTDEALTSLPPKA